LQSLAYFPFAIANALTARLDDGFVPNYLFIILYMITLFTNLIWPSIVVAETPLLMSS
jgi:hypothetical protein